MSQFNNLLTQDDLQNFRIICEAYIFNEKSQIFAQKRSANRLKHPNSWNVVGGHLENGETLEECLVREILEETGWEIEKIIDLIEIIEFELPSKMLKSGELAKEKVFKFLVKAKELKEPILESDKACEYVWFDSKNVEITTQNRTKEQDINYVKNSILKALETLKKPNTKNNLKIN